MHTCPFPKRKSSDPVMCTVSKTNLGGSLQCHFDFSYFVSWPLKVISVIIDMQLMVTAERFIWKNKLVKIDPNEAKLGKALWLPPNFKSVFRSEKKKRVEAFPFLSFFSFILLVFLFLSKSFWPSSLKVLRSWRDINIKSRFKWRLIKHCFIPQMKIEHCFLKSGINLIIH